jgi:predicted lipoprotein with Yx(FWY)xxD motif
VLRFSVGQMTVSEAATNAAIAITLLPAATDVVQVSLSVVGGTAHNGTDYTFTNQIVTFSTAETNRNIDVPIFVDGPGEPTESIVFRLDALTGPAAMGTPIQTAVWITDSFGDSDSDGLPDAWEIQFFGNLDQVAGGDPDGDAVNNLTEFRQGRHPMAGAVADTNNVLKLNVITPLR